MTRPFRAALAAVVLVAALVAIADPANADVSFINSQRAAAGRGAVIELGSLDAMAARHSAQMASSGNLAHTSGLFAAIVSAFPGATGGAENVGVGGSVALVNTAFMNSASHRANILGAYAYAGVGVATGGDGQVWVTQVFANGPGGGAAPAAAPTSPVARAPVAPRPPSAPRASRSADRSALAPPADGAALARSLPTGAPGAPSARTGRTAASAAATPFSRRAPMQFASDGGVFTDGDAQFVGSATELRLLARRSLPAATRADRGSACSRGPTVAHRYPKRRTCARGRGRAAALRADRGNRGHGRRRRLLVGRAGRWRVRRRPRRTPGVLSASRSCAPITAIASLAD